MFCSDFEIHRKEEFGGNIIYKTYDDLAKDFAEEVGVIE